MKYIDDPEKMQVEVIKKTFMVALLPLIVSAATGRYSVLLGLIFGLLISVLLLRLKLIQIKRSIDMPEDKANKFIRNRYFIEYVIYFIVLFVAIRNSRVDFLAAAVGLFLMKATVVGWVVLDIIKNKWDSKMSEFER